MNYRRAVVPGVVVVVAATAVAFGPLVAGVSLATEPQPALNDDGSLTIDSATLPDEATIEPASYGAANYYLTVPSSSVTFGSVTGQPTLVYTLRIRALGLQRSTTHFLDSSVGPQFEATMTTGTLNDDEFARERFDGELSLAVRNSSGQRTLVQRNVTVRVVE